MRSDFLLATRALLGTSFQHQGRVPGVGLDCAGLVVCALTSCEHDVANPSWASALTIRTSSPPGFSTGRLACPGWITANYSSRSPKSPWQPPVLGHFGTVVAIEARGINAPAPYACVCCRLEINSTKIIPIDSIT